MKTSFTNEQRRLDRAYFDLMPIAHLDIELAHGSNIPRRLPFPDSLAIYDRVVEALEAQSEAEEDLP